MLEVLGGSGWAEVVKGITNGDDRAVEQLYPALADTVRFTLSRAGHPEWVEDSVHEVLIVVLQAIRSGVLRDPERLMGFVHRVAQRHCVARIRQAILSRRLFAPSEFEPRAPHSDSPDSSVTGSDRSRVVTRVLRRLSGRDREILERFYLREQPRAQICDEMHLTDTQFRLFKSRAIARCAHATS